MDDNLYDGPGFKPGGGYESGFDYIARTQGNRPAVQAYPDEPGYKSAEHYYVEASEGKRGTPTSPFPPDGEAYDGPGFKPGGGYESGFDYIARTQGDRPVSTPYVEKPTYESGFDADAKDYGNRTMPRFGAKIDGVNITNLIESGKLSADALSVEDRKQVYTQIMYGTTNDLNMLASQIELIMPDKDMVTETLLNQFNLAVEEMSKESRGYHNQDMVDRKFQFLATIAILKEKGYNLSSLRFPKGDEEIDYVEMLSMFQKQCRKNSPVKAMSKSPMWFEGEPPADYNPSRYVSPMMVVTDLIKEEYAKNPSRFLADWEQARKESRLEENKNKPFDIYMTEHYGFNVNRLDDKLTEFLAARAEQMGEDEIERKKVLEATLPKKEETYVPTEATPAKRI